MRFLGLEIIGKNLPARRAANIFDETYWEGKELGPTSISGSRVTPANAMQVGAVNACVRYISQTVASLPCILYRKDANDDRERATDHPLYSVLNVQPTEWLSRFEWMEAMMRNLLLRGNAFAEIIFQGRQIYALNPLHPDKMTLKWVTQGKSKYISYEYQDGGKKTVYRPDQILHLRGPSDDGGLGKGPLQEAREAIGNSITLESYLNFFYANGARLSGVLEHPSTLTDDTAARIAKSFREAYAGAANSGKVAVLEEGMKLNATTMTLKDSEFIGSQKMSVRNIARLFGVPPHVIGDLEDATFSNIEQESLNTIINCVRIWNVRIEMALQRSLLSEQEQEEYYIEFLLDALLRGDFKSRMEGYNIGLQNGMLDINEARKKENLNKRPWGDVTMIPLNMRPVRDEKDLDKPLAAPVDTGGRPAKDEKKALDAPVLMRLFEHFEPQFERIFEAIAKREIHLLDRSFTGVEELRGRMKEVQEEHKKFVRDRLEPLVNFMAASLRFFADSQDQNSTPINEQFMADYTQRHIDAWWDQVLPTEGDKAALEILNGKKREKLYRERITPLLNSVREEVLQGAGAKNET